MRARGNKGRFAPVESLPTADPIHVGQSDSFDIDPNADSPETSVRSSESSDIESAGSALRLRYDAEMADPRFACFGGG